jgi:hypothetical protein
MIETVEGMRLAPKNPPHGQHPQSTQLSDERRREPRPAGGVLAYAL